MQYIHFIVHHTVHDLFDGVNRKIMSGSINHKSSPNIIRLIINEYRSIFYNIFAIWLFLQQLRKSIKAPNKTRKVVSNQLPFLILSYGDLIFFMLQ